MFNFLPQCRFVALAAALSSAVLRAAVVPAFSPDLVIEAGDTVVWEPLYGRVEAYEGSWKSQTFPWESPGRFEQRFDVHGEFAFLRFSPSRPDVPDDFGNIAVIPKYTNTLVYLNSPRDGANMTSAAKVWLQATVKMPAQDVVSVVFYVNGSTVGVATNFPFAISTFVRGTLTGDFTQLIAKAYDRAGNEYVSPPVYVFVNAYECVSLPRVLPDGAFLFRYSTGLLSNRHCILARDSWNDPWNGIAAPRHDFGILIDRDARGKPSRFYRVEYCP